MELVIGTGGDVSCIYAEAIAVASLGTVSIRRASHVEPDDHGCWLCDLSPVAGPILGPFVQRSVALAAEHDWLQKNWLCSGRA